MGVETSIRKSSFTENHRRVWRSWLSSWLVVVPLRLRKRLALDETLAVKPRHDGSVSHDLRYSLAVSVVALELLALAIVPIVLGTVVI